MNNRLRPLLWPGAWLMFGVVLAVAPISPYTATLATEVIILTLWAVSYNLVYGYMGEISFGHAAFFGLGAFGVPLLAREFNLPFGFNIAGGMVVACLFAALVSVIIRRNSRRLLRGAHLCPGGGSLCGCNQMDEFHRRGQRIASLASGLAGFPAQLCTVCVRDRHLRARRIAQDRELSGRACCAGNSSK